jgi:hypothetical protein
MHYADKNLIIMTSPPYPYAIFIVGKSEIGFSYIESYIPEYPAGLGKPAYYICPLSNSLLCGNMPICITANCSIKNPKGINPYG